MESSHEKNSKIYNDAILSATKVLSGRYGKPPKKSVVKAVAKRLAESIPQPVAAETAKRVTTFSGGHVPLAASQSLRSGEVLQA
jgi:hypothetical protein